MLWFGWAGGAVNVFHVLPQMFRIYKTKSVKDISINSFLIKFLAAFLYTIHGFLIWDMPLLVMTGIVLLQYGVIIFQYKYFEKNSKCGVDTAESTTTTTLPTSTETEDLALCQKTAFTSSTIG